MNDSRRITANPGSTDEASVWVKTQDVTKDADLECEFWGPGGFGEISGVSSTTVAGTLLNWQQSAITNITVPTNAEYRRIEMRLDDQGTVWFDDASPKGTTHLPGIPQLLSNWLTSVFDLDGDGKGNGMDSALAAK
jgi:hypothetical protein